MACELLLSSTRSKGGDPSAMIVLLPIMGAVLAGFLTIGMALPVLPLHVHQALGFGSFVVGLVTGCQFGASLFSRIWAGRYGDTRGSKRSVIAGLLAATASGLFYLLSLALIREPTVSVTILLLGRAVLGAAESFIITGGVSWGLALLDSRHAGKVIAWMGTAMFAALALGAPLGTALYSAYGFIAIAGATVLLPLATWLLILRVPAVAPSPARSRPSLRSVAGFVWLPGVGAACSSLGYGAILSFSSLLFANHGWHPVWLAFGAFAVALILSRLIFGHLPDKLGGAKVALIFAVIEAIGLALIWRAAGPLTASAGAVLTSFGYSLVYPGLGMEAVRGVSGAGRGVAIGMYTLFLDVALGFGSPALGLIAGRTNLGTVFAVGGGVALLALPVILWLLGRRPGKTSDSSGAQILMKCGAARMKTVRKPESKNSPVLHFRN
jgi:MFS family permease